MDVLQGLITYPVEGILKSVASLAAQEISLFRGFNKELTELHQSSLEIQEYLGDVAHKPQDQNMAVRNWVKKLKDVAHDADDILEDINYEVLRRKVEIQNHMKKKVLNFFSLSNPILFRQKMAHKIKNINASLAALKSEAPFIGLVARPVDHSPPPIMRNRETDSSFGHDEKIIGREKIVSDIIATLIESKNQQEYLSVKAIVGMGGLGKTTLARSIFNDDAIGRHFVEKMWVCVSDTFDVNLILNRMLESLNSNRTGLTTREALLNDLKQSLTGMRYILILDDVWNEEKNFWREFMDCLSKLNSGPGSIAIVTTRSAKVASITETMPRCVLKGLSVEDCWSVLKGEALPYGNASSLDSNQQRIGMAIAKKCVGVPLAAKVLGSLMRSQEWLLILESKIWELPDGEDRIMSILKLSFDNLREPSLKQCFAYCSIFEKDCAIIKDDLVQLWMAQGYLHSSPMEDKGNEHFDILLQNSLFQNARNYEYGNTKCKMHDLVHDLAEEVFKFESLMRDLDQMDDGALEIQHVARISSTTLERFLRGSVRRLRSLFPPRGFEFSNMFERFRDLRTLNLYNAEIEELPISIGKLKRLRYLNISCTKIKELPKSIGKLYNLQTLRMSGTYNLETFPREMENLINLRHVYFTKDKEFPFRITRLTHLQALRSFTLDRARRHTIDELDGLNELKGKLVIGSLEYVRDKEEAMKSNLVRKKHIRKLELKWERSHSAERNGNFLDQDILEGLQSPPNLESLRIVNFMGTKFASCMMSDSLTEIQLSNCKKCDEVPPLGHLRKLRRIDIVDCPNLKSIPISSSQSLEELRIEDCPKLICTSIHSLPSLCHLQIEKSVGFSPEAEGEDDLSLNGCTSLRELRIKECTGFTSILSGLHSCTSLRTLRIDIVDCPNLKSIPISSSQSLERLYIARCPRLRCASIHSLPSLRHLQIEQSVGFSSEEEGEDDLSLNGCTSLRELIIEGCDGFTSILSGLHSCTSLRTLRIRHCRNLRTLSGHGQQTPVSLENMYIQNCLNLEALPSLDNLTSLTELNIENCGGLTSIPSGLASCTSLTRLSVYGCHNLISLADHSLFGLQSLSTLFVSNCGRLHYLPKGLPSLSRLKRLWIGKFCKELDSFPDFQVPSENLMLHGWPKLKSLPQPIQHSTSLTSLSISKFDGVEALPEWLGNLTSLTELTIWECKNLMYLPKVKAMQRLTKLHKLEIHWCPRLKERCSKDGPEWPKIYHIPVIIAEESESLSLDDSKGSCQSDDGTFRVWTIYLFTAVGI